MITAPWLQAIDRFCIAQRAAGLRETSIRARREHLQHLARRVELGPWELTKDALVTYAGTQTWMPETRRSRRSTFNEFYKWGRRNGYVSKSPVKALPKVQATKGKARPLPETAYRRALAKADDRTELVLRCAHDAGLRRGEIAVIHERDIHEDLIGWSLLVHGKGGKRRVVPLTRRLALDLRTACAGGYAFPGAIDGHLSPRRVGELAIEVLPAGWTLHKLRHSFGTRALKVAGGNVLIVQELMGHASADTTGIYVEIDPADVRDVVDAAYDRSVNSGLTPKLRALEGVA
jgi:integrase/recombinase XerC